MANSVEEGDRAVRERMEAVGLSDDAGHHLRLDQATFFRCVKDCNLPSLHALLRNRKLDVNAYNDDGVTALHLAVYEYEKFRNLEIAETLLKHGADVLLKAAATRSTHKVSFVRHDSRNPHSDTQLATKKVDFDQKPPLLIALELKSSLYLKGWEYRHWDAMLKLLADASLKYYSAKGVQATTAARDVLSDIQNGWGNVFQSEKHELVEIWSEGKHLVALKLLLTSASTVLKLNIENAAALSSSRVEIKEASFNILKIMVEFLYTSKVEPQLMTQRGIDIFCAAHKYGVESLKSLCESEIIATQDNWIKLLSAATECNSEVLAAKCAESINRTMDLRREGSTLLKKSFSESLDVPGQLFEAK